LAHPISWHFQYIVARKFQGKKAKKVQWTLAAAAGSFHLGEIERGFERGGKRKGA
jgi:hypothetical protein